MQAYRKMSKRANEGYFVLVYTTELINYLFEKSNLNGSRVQDSSMTGEH